MKSKYKVRLVKVRDVNKVLPIIKKYFLLYIFVLQYFNRKLVIAYLVREIYIVENLKATILLDIDILGSKKITLDFEKRILRISNYKEITIDLDIKLRDF